MNPAARIGLARLVTLSSLVAIAGCGGGGSEGTPGSAAAPQVITVDGSSTVAPVTEAVAEEFQKAQTRESRHGRHLRNGGGFQKFCRDEIDISDASRPIRPDEKRRVREGRRHSTSRFPSPTTVWPWS